jgi:hypothetical protein
MKIISTYPTGHVASDGDKLWLCLLECGHERALWGHHQPRANAQAQCLICDTETTLQMLGGAVDTADFRADDAPTQTTLASGCPLCGGALAHVPAEPCPSIELTDPCRQAPGELAGDGSVSRTDRQLTPRDD